MTEKLQIWRILVLEDNKHDFYLIQRALQKWGLPCEITWVQRAEEALEKVPAQPFDIILTDFHLPGLSGLELLDQMSQQGVGVPIIFITGSGTEFVAVEAMKRGAQDYLVKDPQQEYLKLLPIVIQRAYEEWENKVARQRAEASLQQYALDLAAQNAELDAFAHTVAHDLKTPLSVIIGFSQLLLKNSGYIQPKEEQYYLNLIADTGQQMNKIIEDLLLLADIRRRQLIWEPINMAEIIPKVQDQLAFMIGQMAAVVEVATDWHLAMGYAPWIERVWANYVSNGLKYGGQPPHIILGCDPPQSGFVRFWIWDNGPGISLEQQSRLFRSFSRLDELDSTRKGHGLGLSIVQRIVQKYGGDVGVESKLGQGSLFWFTLPESH